MGNIVVSVVSGTVTGISEYKESRNRKVQYLMGFLMEWLAQRPGFSEGICNLKEAVMRRS